MKNGRFSDAQIMAVLKQAESGVPVSELCREHGMSSASFYKWRAKFGGMDASLVAECRYVRTPGTLPVNSLIWDGGSIHDERRTRHSTQT